MSSSDLAISARGLGKAYTIRHVEAPPTTLAEAVVRRLRRPLRRDQREVFWALKEVSFDVSRGEVVGVIGRNGAGKSTLLKILSRITEMTEGEVELHGRVGSLLEVGTGFHQELTGRENVFLAGTILGMSRAEIRTHFDEIVDFAGVERFLDTPVKRYSSGMYVRLAFAVAAHLRSEILIVDEVLAVGDAEFQKKCLDKMRDVSTDGRTVLFVSHSMHSIKLLCDTVMVLDAGRVSYVGDAATGIEMYSRQSVDSPSRASTPSSRRPGSGEYRFDDVRADKSVYASSETKRIRFTVVHGRSQLGRFYPSAHLFDENGLELAQLDGRLVGCWMEDAPALEGELAITGPWLKPGRYRLDLYLCTGSGIVDHLSQACVFEVSSVLPYPCAADARATASGVVFADYTWRTKEGGQYAASLQAQANANA